MNRHRTYTLYTIALPLLAFSFLGLSGCEREEEIPPATPGGTYLSTSAGASFAQSVDIKNQPGSYIAQFELHEIHRPAHNPNKIYIAAGANGVVLSEDDGQTWDVIRTPLTRTLDIIELENGVLVASGVDGVGQGYVVRSLDRGESWDSVFTIPVPVEEQKLQLIGGDDESPAVVLTIEPDPFNPDRIYAGSNLGTLYVGLQSAKVWRRQNELVEEGSSSSNQQIAAVRKLVPSPHTQGEVMVITQNRTLLRVTDDDEEEIKVPQQIDEPSRFSSFQQRDVYDVSYIQQFPNALLIGVEDGVVVTRDQGETWLRLRVPVEATTDFNSVVVSASPTNPDRILAAVNSVIYRSEDGGDTWNTAALGLPNHIIVDMSINPANAARVLVVTQPIQQ